MKSFIASNPGRILVIHLGKGEKVLESIKKELARYGIKNGVLLSAIGSLRKASFHYINNVDDLPENKYLNVESPIEMASLQGLVINGDPHFHITFSDLNRVYTGHLENGCEVQYLAEISIMEINEMNLTRKTDKFGISYIDKKEM